ERYFRTFTYQPVDRVPDIEFGFWPQTIRRWLKQGLPLEMTREEQMEMFSVKLHHFFGFDWEETRSLTLRTGMNPLFEEQILERRNNSVIMRDSSGVLAQRFLNDVDDSSIPHFLKFPVETPADWERLKAERFRLDDPTRVICEADVTELRRAMREGMAILSFCCGFYGQLRNWMGTERLSYAFYDEPGMIHDMVEHWAELCAQQIEQYPADIPIDIFRWWEDMAGKGGPLIGPDTFREFLQPGYQRVMTAAKKRGCTLGWVDSDGEMSPLIPNWLKEGVNIMFPIEIEAGCDPYAWRRKHGRELRLQGGIAKAPLVEGGRAIDRELERIRPLLEQGGYIPQLDHLVPPDISYKNFCEYLEKKRKLIGRYDLPGIPSTPSTPTAS
ncbi:MAG: uroporphyrinogen decarboxylase family protein, partial [Kiritimatiellae bacterium]|nr:uroporphyrinogen decarboxylase family protein [Kiritimatiellia bacterium]